MAPTTNTWLLTWEPGGDEAQNQGSPLFSTASKDTPIPWPCAAEGVKVGDHVYVMRLTEPKGLVALGEVAKGAKNGSIEILVLESRPSCAEGLLPETILIKDKGFTSYDWSPAISGQSIPSEVLEKLTPLWKEGEGGKKSSLHQFVEWFCTYEDYQSEINLSGYKETVEKAKVVKRDLSKLDDDLLRLFWREESNGVSSLAPGGKIEEWEYVSNQSFLKEATERILGDFSPETGREVIKEIKMRSKPKSAEPRSSGHFYDGKPAAVRRLFAALDPVGYTALLNEWNCKKVIKELNTKFQLESDKPGSDWFAINGKLKHCRDQAKIDSSLLLEFNKAVWGLHELVVEGKETLGGKNSEGTSGSKEVAEKKEVVSMNQIEKILLDQILDGPLLLNQILYGPPGTGKTHQTKARSLKVLDRESLANSKNLEDISRRYQQLVDEGRIFFVTFHQSFSYEDFVEGIRAQVKDGVISYEVESGIFLKACQAASQPDQPVVLIIDEINRGNISSIFGELITLIEPSKRLGASDARTVILPYSKKSKSEEQFGVPSNLYIIGTMNTADRSLALLDTALRRRFDFIEVEPNPALLAGYKVKGIDVQKLLEKMNERIEVALDRDHRIGHSYFMSLKDQSTEEEEKFDHLGHIFQNQVIPLLEEYFFEDWKKIRYVLGDNGKKSEKHQFILEEEVDDMPDESDDSKLLYRKNLGALKETKSYKLIYGSG